MPTGNTAYTIEAFVKSGTVNLGGIAGWGTYGLAGQSNVLAMSSSPQGYRNYHWQSDLVATTRNSVAFNNAWHHVVAQFDGTNQRIYEDGYLLATNTATHSVTGTSNLTIGMANANEWFNGCLSNLRIVKGVAVYGGTSTTAANFTVPVNYLAATQSSSTNIAAITGTQTALLLNNRNNLLTDASTWGYTLTAYNSPTTSSSGPALTAAGPAISYAATTTLPSTSVSVTPVSTGSTVTAYSVSAGTPLPGTLNLNTTTGVISGTAPSAFGTYTYTINAIDGASNSSSANFVLQVSKLTPTVTTTFATPPSTGVANTINASSSAPGVISFQNNSGSISGCINKNTTGSGPYTATCAWTPASGSYSITATITPTDSNSYDAAISTAVTGTVAGPGSFTVTGADNGLIIEMPTAKAIMNNSAYTVEAWIKIDPATNTVATGAQDYGRLDFSGGTTDQWNQRTGTWDSRYGSYYMTNNSNGASHPRCDGSTGTAATCPLIVIPRGQWTHLAMQKSYLTATTQRQIMFIDGKVVSSYEVVSSSTLSMNVLRVGSFGSGASTSKASYSQMRITAGSLYPTAALGATAFIPTYDWTTTVTGSSVSAGATVLALFKPQSNSTPSGLGDLTGNGSTLRLSNTGNSVTATSDYAAPPPPAFSYSGGSRSTITGTALPTTTPVSTGGDINSYSINPALPNGLNLNTTTGEISGTPTLSSPTTTYVVTGTQASSGLLTTANISITVNKPATTITLQLAN
ncbi:MAG: LamG-like jellyroll fold domain-containing protein, partial [Actinomycetes bacterium]